MKLLFLSEKNLRSKPFIINLVHNYSLPKGSLLIHDVFGGTVKDTRFVTKRLSAVLSESMVVNNAFSGDQRNLFSQEDDQLVIRTEYLLKLAKGVQLLILNPIVKTAEGPALVPVESLLHRLRAALPIQETILFPDNDLSPLVAQKTVLDTTEDYDRLVAVYEEEKDALSRAKRLRPVTLASPVNYAK